MSNNIDPTSDQFSAMFKLPTDQKIWMLNMIKLREKANYENGDDVTGADAYATYSSKTEEFFKGVGGRIVWSGTPQLVLIGPADEQWDLCFVAEYPNAVAFGEMVQNPGYQAIVHHRQAAVEDSRLIRINPSEGGGPFG